jgi:hypothetical protein
VAYLAIDPGDTTGWCTFDAAGKLLEMGQAVTKTDKEFNQFISGKIDSSLLRVICEDYVLFKHKAMAQTNSRGRNLSTAKQVGKVELLCDLKNVPFTKQESSKYRIGAMWGGFEIPSNHSISHQYVAAAHGVFYLQTAGIRKPSIGA